MDIYERIKRYEQTEHLLLQMWTEASNRLAIWIGGEDIRQTEEYKHYQIIARDLYAVQTRLAEMRSWPR